ncbi:MAG: hypothetical protein U0Y10_21320 [Spirosomataceae bacterium]
MILLQTPLSQNTLMAIVEALALMAIAAYIGWWLARRTLAVEIAGLKSQIADKRVELDDCRKSKVYIQPEIQPISVTPPAAAIPGVTTFVPVEPASPVIPDDLKVVEGIGPKIEQLLHDAGILTFRHLAATSPDKLTEILRNAGPRFQIHDPTTWPQQAELAGNGKWDELKKWQDELKGGKVD